MSWLEKRLAPYFEDPSPQRNLPMEGIRGLAVLMVFWVHYPSVFRAWILKSPLAMQWAESFASVGLCGVDLFFVLSGYLIYATVIRSSFQYGKFAWRRVVRLYPTFFATFVLYLALSLLFPQESKMPANVWDRALYLGANLAMLPGIFPIRPLITVAWSLSYEIFFYLTLPVLVAALRLRTQTPFSRLVMLGLISAVGVVVAFAIEAMQGRMVLFFSGIVLFEARSHWLKRPQREAVGRAWLNTGAIGFVLLWPLAWMFEAEAFLSRVGWSVASGQQARLLLLVFALPPLLFVALDKQGPLAAFFSGLPLRWLGNMSYSFYLLHGLTLKALWIVAGRIFPGGGPLLFWSAWPVALVVAFGTSFLLYVGVERRFSLGALPKAVVGKRTAALPVAVPASVRK